MAAIDGDPAACGRHVLETLGPEARAGGLQVEATLQTAWTLGQRELVERLVANLLENAIRHNVASGWVAVEAGEGPDGPFLTARNSGPVVAPGDVDRLLLPFHRATANRTQNTGGHGLGLSIVQAIAQAHRAALRIEAPAAGGLAARVRFRFPGVPLRGAIPDPGPS